MGGNRARVGGLAGIRGVGAPPGAADRGPGDVRGVGRRRCADIPACLEREAIMVDVSGTRVEGPLESFVSGFAAELARTGYTPLSVRAQLAKKGVRGRGAAGQKLHPRWGPALRVGRPADGAARPFHRPRRAGATAADPTR